MRRERAAAIECQKITGSRLRLLTKSDRLIMTRSGIRQLSVLFPDLSEHFRTPHAATLPQCQWLLTKSLNHETVSRAVTAAPECETANVCRPFRIAGPKKSSVPQGCQ